MNNIYFHIGYPKSASTTLQKQLFNKHSQIINLGLYPTKNIGNDTEKIDNNALYIKDEQIKLFYDNLLKKDEINYQNTNNSNILKEILDKYYDNDKAIVFSEERATSVFFTHPDIGVKLNRIKDLIPDAKIIIVVRNQIDALSSMYADFPFDPRSIKIGKYIDINEWIEIVLNEEFIYYREMLNYYNIIKYCEKLFGIENICILEFEELLKNKEEFSNKISSFLQIDSKEALDLLLSKHENKRVSHRYNIARAVKKKYLPNTSLRKIFGDQNTNKINSFFKKGKSKKYELSKEIKKKINDFYHKDNEKLQNIYDIEFNRSN